MITTEAGIPPRKYIGYTQSNINGRIIDPCCYFHGNIMGLELENVFYNVLSMKLFEESKALQDDNPDTTLVIFVCMCQNKCPLAIIMQLFCNSF